METKTESVTDGYSLPTCSAANFLVSVTSMLPTSFGDDNWMRMAGKHFLDNKCCDQYLGETGCNTKMLSEDTRGIPAHAYKEGVKSLNQGSEKGCHIDASKRDFDGRNASFNQSSSKNVFGYSGEPIWVNIDSKAGTKTGKIVKDAESESDEDDTILDMELESDDESSGLSSCCNNGIFSCVWSS